MHSLTAFIDVPHRVVDQFADQLRQPHGSVTRMGAADRFTILCAGDSPSVVRHWQDTNRTVTAFGSAVRHLDHQRLSDIVDSIEQSARLPEDLADIVVLAHREGGGFMAVTGGGAHRLFRREIPSGGTVLSTHLGSVVTTDSPASVDRTFEDFFLGFGFHPEGRTMFAGVEELPPLSIWSPTGPETRDLGLSEVAADSDFDSGSELIDLLLTATQRQTEGVEHCAVLLGGFDSALVCALLRELGKTVTAFTFDFGDDRFNQANIGLVADWLDIDHRWVGIDAERMITGFTDLPQLLNAPGAQPHYQLHTVFACEEVENGEFELAVTGDGCDAIFLGYPTIYRRSSLMSRLQRVPGPIGRTMISTLGFPPLDRSLGHVARTGRSALRAAMLPYPASGHLPTQYLDAVSLSKLRADGDPPQQEPVEDTRLRLAAGLESLSPAALAFRGYSLTGASRIKVDGSVMHTGVAQATPFKYPAVARFAKDLPQSALRPEGASARGLGKQYLMDVVIDSGLLPTEVVVQEKQSPSTSPIDYWYMGELRDPILERLEDLPFEWNRAYVESLLRPKRAEDWYREHIALSPHALHVVGILLSYAAFARLAR